MSTNSDVVIQMPAQLRAVLDQHASQIVEPPMLIAANDYFDLAGEEFGRRLLLTVGSDGGNYCLRPEFTLPIAQDYIRSGRLSAETYGYCGRVFRQRAEGPTEFTQMGLELVGHENASLSFDKVLKFVSDVLNTVDAKPNEMVFGSIELFERVLRNVGIPEVWWPRLRHRFGHPEALSRFAQKID